MEIDTNTWVSMPFGKNNENISDYCVYCFKFFKKYNEMIQNICISCGRPAPRLTENKQQHAKLSGYNDSQDGLLEGISIEIDTSDSLKDESTSGSFVGSRMQANSLHEAVQLLHESETPRRLQGKELFKIRIRGQEQFAKLDTHSTEDDIR